MRFAEPVVVSAMWGKQTAYQGFLARMDDGNLTVFFNAPVAVQILKDAALAASKTGIVDITAVQLDNSIQVDRKTILGTWTRHTINPTQIAVEGVETPLYGLQEFDKVDRFVDYLTDAENFAKLAINNADMKEYIAQLAKGAERAPFVLLIAPNIQVYGALRLLDRVKAEVIIEHHAMFLAADGEILDVIPESKIVMVNR